MYTKKRLNQFADWFEQQGEINEKDKRETAEAVLSGILKHKKLHKNLDINDLNIKNIIRMFRFKIGQIKFDELGICTKKDEKMVFQGIEQFREEFEIQSKRQVEVKSGEKSVDRASGWQ